MAGLRIGSRGSQLALWQANHISSLLSARGHEVEIEIIHTTGDKITDVALAKVGTKGMFTKEIEEALAAGPPNFPPGLKSPPSRREKIRATLSARGNTRRSRTCHAARAWGRRACAGRRS